MGVLRGHRKLAPLRPALPRNARRPSASATVRLDCRIRPPLWVRSLGHLPHWSHSVHRSHPARRWPCRLPASLSKHSRSFLRNGQQRFCHGLKRIHNHPKHSFCTGRCSPGEPTLLIGPVIRASAGSALHRSSCQLVKRRDGNSRRGSRGSV